MFKQKPTSNTDNIELRYISIFILILSGILLLHEYYFISKAIVTTGEVTNTVSYHDPGSKTKTSYTTVISFTAQDGKKYYRSAGRYYFASIGDKVKVYYDPKDPSDSLVSEKKLKLILAVIGILFFILSKINFKKKEKPAQGNFRSTKR